METQNLKEPVNLRRKQALLSFNRDFASFDMIFSFYMIRRLFECLILSGFWGNLEFVDSVEIY